MYIKKKTTQKKANPRLAPVLLLGNGLGLRQEGFPVLHQLQEKRQQSQEPAGFCQHSSSPERAEKQGGAREVPPQGTAPPCKASRGGARLVSAPAPAHGGSSLPSPRDRMHPQWGSH